MSKFERLRRQWPEKSVVFLQVHALYLSADKLIHFFHYTGMRGQQYYVTAVHSGVMYSAWNPKDNYDMSASVFVVQFNGFMSLTS